MASEIGKPRCPYDKVRLYIRPEVTFMKVSAPSPITSRKVVVAVLLGTALSSLGNSASAAPVSEKAINDINRYCTACWRNARLHPDSWNDCTQAVFVRLLQRLSPDGWNRVLQSEGEERREFLRAIDAVKKRTQRSRKYAPLSDDHTRPERSFTDEWETVQHAADKVLSDRQQQILRLSREGWTVQEMVEELGLPAERISDEKYKAIRKLRVHLGESGT